MTELTIYDSHGNPYGESGRGRPDERIENFFFGGVKLYLERGSQTELVVFFRARESNVGRSEQFYAVYKTRQTSNLFDQFKSDLRHRVENEYGMSLETSSDDVAVYSALGTGSSSVPGTDFNHELISSLLRSGNRLRFGVSSPKKALALCSKYLQESAQRVAIADSTDIDELANCDLAVEIGNHRGLEPLGDTQRLLDEQRRSMEGKLVNEKVSTIKGEIQDLRTKTSKSDTQIRNRIKREVSIFETPPPPSSNDGPFGVLSKVSRTQRIAAGVIGVVLLISLVAIVAAGLLGASLPIVGSIGPLGPNDAGGDDAGVQTAALENLSINGKALENITTENGTPSVSLSDGNVTINGETNQTVVNTSFVSNDGNITATDRWSGEDGSFEVILSGLQPAEGTLTIEAGTGGMDENSSFEAVENKTVTVELTDGGENRNESQTQGGDETQDDGENRNDNETQDDGSQDGGTQDDDTQEAPLENATVGDIAFADIQGGNGTEQIKLDNGTVTVSGETNQDAVNVSFDNQNSSDTEQQNVTGDSFEVSLSGLEAGEGTLVVKVGSVDGTDGFNAEERDSVDIELTT